MAKPKNLDDAKVYNVPIYGEAVVNMGGHHELKKYEVVAKMTHGQIRQFSPEHIFKKYLAEALVSPLLPGFVSVVTHFIGPGASCPEKPELVASNPIFLTDQALKDFIEENDMPIQPELYDDDYALRQAIVECLEEEEAFIKNQKILEERKGPSAALRREVLALNSPTENDRRAANGPGEEARDIQQDDEPGSVANKNKSKAAASASAKNLVKAGSSSNSRRKPTGPEVDDDEI